MFPSGVPTVQEACRRIIYDNMKTAVETIVVGKGRLYNRRFLQVQPQRIVGDLLTAEISEKQARSIKYQLTVAKLPLAKDTAHDYCASRPADPSL